MIYTFTAEALNRVREKITTEIKTQLDAKNLNATRKLRNSISGTVFASSKSISLSIFAAEYFDSVDKGTKPGKRPPYRKIYEWANAKGIQPRDSKSFNQMIKNIQEAIFQNGTIKRFAYKGASIIDYVDEKYKEEITQEIKEGYLKDLESEININGNS